MAKFFLDTDHKISLDESVQIINSEIQWCHQEPMISLVTPQFRDGFIRGLEQAKLLLIMLAKNKTES